MANPLHSVREQIKNACQTLNLPKEVHELLKDTERMIEVSIPLTKEDGSVEVYKAYRAVHQTATGPGKGGIRFHEDVYADEVKALSIWMSMKSMITGLPFGGGKGGVAVDSKSLSEGDLERLARKFVRKIHPFLGENIDIPAPDVGSSAKLVAAMTDEYMSIVGQHELGVFTGKPVSYGGSLGREQATGYGVVLNLEEYLKTKEETLENKKVAIQGFGNVGSFTVKFLEGKKAKVVSLLECDKEMGSYGIYHDEGFSYEELKKYQKENKSLYNFPKGEKISEEEFFELDLDVLIPAALENAVDEERAKKLNAKILVEAANGPTTSEADAILKKRGIPVLPDVLVNAGGVVVSYFEWVQNKQGFYWSEEEVVKKQEELMRDSFDKIHQMSEKHEVSYREGAYLFAVKRLAEALEARGDF